MNFGHIRMRCQIRSIRKSGERKRGHGRFVPCPSQLSRIRDCLRISCVLRCVECIFRGRECAVIPYSSSGSTALRSTQALFS